MNIVLRWYLRCIEKWIFRWWCRKCSCYLIPMSLQKWGGFERENIVYANQYSKNVLSSCPKDRLPRFTCSYRLKIQAMPISTWLQTFRRLSLGAASTYLKTSREIKWIMKNSSCWGHVERQKDDRYIPLNYPRRKDYPLSWAFELGHHWTPLSLTPTNACLQIMFFLLGSR